ncbi:MAG: hypothetical protein IT303_14220 [Dehalococcoidia bacterium]|nr:hypothetical protein [Dehalococcoidia bacterium]
MPRARPRLGFRLSFALMVAGIALGLAATISAVALAYAQFKDHNQSTSAEFDLFSSLGRLGQTVYELEGSGLIALLLREPADVEQFRITAGRTEASIAEAERRAAEAGISSRVSAVPPAVRELRDAFDAALNTTDPTPAEQMVLEVRVRAARAAVQRELDRSLVETSLVLEHHRSERADAEQAFVGAVIMATLVALGFTALLSVRVWREFGRRDRAERELLASEAARRDAEGLVQAVVDHAPMILVLVDENGDARMVSGSLRERIIAVADGLNVGRLPERYQPMRPMIEAAMRGEETSTTVPLDPWIYDVSFQPFSYSGRRGAVLTFWDATERERAAEARSRAEQLQSLAVVAGGVAHDLNNALVTVMLSMELASHLVTDPDAKEMMREAFDAAGRAGQLGRAMLMYTGRAHREAETVDMTALANSLAPSEWHSGREVRFETGDGLPLVQGDPEQLRQVVENLVLNAVEATAAGGDVEVHTSGVTLEEETRLAFPFPVILPPGRYVRVEVRDTGEGMDADTLSHAFEPFYTTRFTGRGLGLAATMGIVRSHGGAIDVTSSPGEGSTFVVLLPARAEAAADPEAAAQQTAA